MLRWRQGHKLYVTAQGYNHFEPGRFNIYYTQSWYDFTNDHLEVLTGVSTYNISSHWADLPAPKDTVDNTVLYWVMGLETQQTCNEKDLRAGMGISAAMKNANMLLKDVRNTLTPVLARQSATGSWSEKSIRTDWLIDF